LNAPVSKTGLPERVAGVRISPSPLLEIRVIFTGERRVVLGRRGVVVGKRTCIYNELPRIAWVADEFPIDQTEVRTSFLGKFEFFRLVV
jgi:hypothetical protein